jgi:hypothetical protein
MALPKRVIQEEEKPELIAGIILRSQSGEGEQLIAEALGLTRHQVRALKASPDYLEILRKQKEEAEKRVVSHVVSQLEDMTPLFLEGFKKNLQEGKADSQRLFVEMIGLKAKDSGGETQLGGITVIMPGAKEEKFIPADKGDDDVVQ